VAVAVSCVSDPAPETTRPPADVTFDDLVTLWEERCGACHLHGFASGGFSFDEGAADLVGVESRFGMVYAEPGSTDESYLWHKVTGTHLEVGGFGARMPIGPPLDARETARIEDWIVSGCMP
jgi:hypothetical protein